MLMMKERRPAFRTIEGWARSVLLDAGAIREWEEQGWMRDRADPHARERERVGCCVEQRLRQVGAGTGADHLLIVARF
jgi:hypothetical protein